MEHNLPIQVRTTAINIATKERNLEGWFEGIEEEGAIFKPLGVIGEKKLYYYLKNRTTGYCRDANEEEIEAFHAGYHFIEDYRNSTLPKFTKGQYIVIKPTAKFLYAFKRNYIYKQRELARVLKPEVCSLGCNYTNSVTFTADDNSYWRLASASEIVLYNNNGGPCDSTDISFDIELETAERILLREDFCVNVPEELHGTYIHFAHALSKAVGEEYKHLTTYYI